MPFQPLYTFLLLLVLLLSVRLWRKRRDRGARIVMFAATLLSVASWPPCAWLTTKTLETGYDSGCPPDIEKNSVGAIVVLSAGVQPPAPGRPYTLPDRSTELRCEHAAWIYREWSALPILATGGYVGPKNFPEESYASVMRQVLVQSGVAPEHIWTEERARSTYENAVYSGEILRARGIQRVILVTQAFHMRRAELVFRKQGIDVVPAPCDRRTADFPTNLLSFVPSANAILRNEEVAHEWAGIAWYWMRGRL